MTNLARRFAAGIPRRLTVAAVAAAGLVAQPSPAAPLFEETTLWTRHDFGKAAYHVHGLALTKSGTVLAFSEARDGWRDEEPHALMLRRSTDGGRTWLPAQVIEQPDGSYWAAHGQAGRQETWTNPAALTDRETGRAFFFYALNEGALRGRNTQRMTQVFMKTSDDDGVIWSDRVDITPVLNVNAAGAANVDAAGKPVLNAEGFPCDFEGRAFHMPGPGHGLQLSNGRVLLQFWHRRPLGAVAEDGSFRLTPSVQRDYDVSVIYSDNHGVGWKTGGYVALGRFVTETRLAQLADGRVMLNGRIDAPAEVMVEPANARGTKIPASKHRWVAISQDLGLSWEPGRIDFEVPPFAATDSGFIRYIPTSTGARECLLLSHPTGLASRKGLAVCASFDSGATWPAYRLVHPFGCQYSDLVQLPGGMIGLLYGKSAAKPSGPLSDFVVFARFNQEWLFAGPQAQ